MIPIQITPLTESPAILAALTTILTEAVAHNASVSFLAPLAPQTAEAFWTQSLQAAANGHRIILGAYHNTALIGPTLVGTVTLLLDTPQNQPHRAEIAKLIVRPSHQGQGIAAALMREAEAHAMAAGRTLINLDTATIGGARSLYEKLGYTLTGEIPDYALTPDGILSGTLIYWKRLPKMAAGDVPEPAS
jgi:ribosomal protein S18 acetylase RimI-like enzyme